MCCRQEEQEEEPTPDESDEEVPSALAVSITEAFRVVIVVGCGLSSTARLSFPCVFRLTDRGIGRDATGTWSGEHWVRSRKQVLGGLQRL